MFEDMPILGPGSSYTPTGRIVDQMRARHEAEAILVREAGLARQDRKPNGSAVQKNDSKQRPVRASAKNIFVAH